MVEVTDSGFTPENIADAEWLWTNLPTFPRNWSSLPTHEKALIVHTAARLRIEAAKAERDRLQPKIETLEAEKLKSLALQDLAYQNGAQQYAAMAAQSPEAAEKWLQNLRHRSDGLKVLNDAKQALESQP